MRRPGLIALLLCIGIIAASCGSSSTNTTPTTSSVGTSSAATTNPAVSSSPTASSSTPMATSMASPSTASSTSGSANPVKITIATGFNPSMSNAAIYLAAEKGYYAAEGLDVTIKDGSNPDLLAQIGTDSIAFGVSGGDSVIPARAAGIPVRTVMQFFTKYPVGLVALANSNVSLNSPSDLKGLNIGVSQLNGSTYFGLLALLQAGNLTKNDVHITTIGFTELEALSQKRVDAVMTFMSNEPVNARDIGIQTKSLQVSDYMNLMSSGLVTSDTMIQQHPDIVQKVVSATVKGMNEALQNPDEAYQATIKRMPELTTNQDKQTQKDILTETQKYQQPVAGHPTGWGDPNGWSTTASFLKSVGVITKDVDPSTCYTNQFVEQAK